MKVTNKKDALVGSWLKRVRLNSGTTQKQLGDGLGITFQQVQKYEKGINRVSVSRLSDMAEYFMCEFSDMLPPEIIENGQPKLSDNTDCTLMKEYNKLTSCNKKLTIQLMGAMR